LLPGFISELFSLNAHRVTLATRGARPVTFKSRCHKHRSTNGQPVRIPGQRLCTISELT